MSFGINNAPTTFQSCMNHIFKDQLRKLVLVLFNDILVYTKTWQEHLRHLDEVLNIMEAQSLYAKESKCEFGMIKIFWIQCEKLHLQHVSPHLIMFSKDPFQGGSGFIGSLTGRYVKKEIGRNKTANCFECLIHAI
jgi:hypothetical protein